MSVRISAWNLELMLIKTMESGQEKWNIRSLSAIDQIMEARKGTEYGTF